MIGGKRVDQLLCNHSARTPSRGQTNIMQITSCVQTQITEHIRR